MFEISPYLEDLAKSTIEKFPELNHLDDPDLNIVYLISEKKKRQDKKIVYADTEKVKDKYNSICNADFIITFYADSEGLDDERMEILMHHELLHVGWDGENKSILPHDICDFRDIIEAHGLDWVQQ